MLIPWLVVLILVHASTGQALQEQPQELARRVIQNELLAEGQDHSHWMFRLETERKNGEMEVDEVVETNDGDLKFPIVIDGRELIMKQKQKQNSEKRLEQFVQNPAALRKTLKDQGEDAARSGCSRCCQRHLFLPPENDEETWSS
jgi:hypothetical protein